MFYYGYANDTDAFVTNEEFFLDVIIVRVRLDFCERAGDPNGGSDTSLQGIQKKSQSFSDDILFDKLACYCGLFFAVIHN